MRPARRMLFLGLILAGTLANAPMAFAEHAKISLDVSSKAESKTAFMDQTPPDTGKNPRPIVKAKTGEMVKVQYLLTNIYPHKTLENVVVHFYVAKQAKPGLKSLPDLTVEGNLIMETAFDMDMKPGGKAGARTSLKFDKAGVYLVRVESLKTQSDHEHFAAIDVVVED